MTSINTTVLIKVMAAAMIKEENGYDDNDEER